MRLLLLLAVSCAEDPVVPLPPRPRRLPQTPVASRMTTMIATSTAIWDPSISLHLADTDRLGALPKCAATDLAQSILPTLVGLDGGEMVRRELTDLR